MIAPPQKCIFYSQTLTFLISLLFFIFTQTRRRNSNRQTAFMKDKHCLRTPWFPTFLLPVVIHGGRGSGSMEKTTILILTMRLPLSFVTINKYSYQLPTVPNHTATPLFKVCGLNLVYYSIAFLHYYKLHLDFSWLIKCTLSHCHLSHSICDWSEKACCLDDNRCNIPCNYLGFGIISITTFQALIRSDDICRAS